MKDRLYLGHRFEITESMPEPALLEPARSANKLFEPPEVQQAPFLGAERSPEPIETERMKQS